jgi:predicted methyltransferase
MVMHATARFVAGNLLMLLLASCSRQEPPAEPAATTPVDPVAAAVSDTTRPAAARVQDSFRRPAEILAFSGVKPGDFVIEIGPGTGYYTALLSRAVGPTGRVLAIDSERLFEYMPKARESFADYAAADPRDNVEYRPQRLDELELPEGADQVWIVQFYHDTVYLGDDRAAMNRSIFEGLAPGGVYMVIDHHAAEGTGVAAARELHRVDAALVRAEVEAAGFVLESQSDILAHPEDPRTDSVFDDQRRGRTDQFVFRFIKPR